METRMEEDSLGPVEVPRSAYYGAFTARAKKNFAITHQQAHPAFITALGQIKAAAARTNNDLGLLPDDTADAIETAAEELADGEFNDEFVLDVLQAGAGTPFHMNANEIIANRATELLGGKKGEYMVHPNDDVNMGQSSNNVIPTAIRLATLEMAADLIAELEALADSLREAADEADDTVKVGRTHLQDAVPITVGQELSAYATHFENGAERIRAAMEELHAVGLGGNAIGTGINTPEAFREHIVRELSSETVHPLRPAEDPLAMTQSMAPFAAFTGAINSMVSDGIKVADDLMMLSSGPISGLGELSLPEVEPGSSIMPGKVNPSIVEAYKMACLDAKGKHATVSAAAEHGDLELNVMSPLIAKNLFEMLDELTNATRMLRERCIDGLVVNKDRIADLFEGSTATATALSPYIGYHRTAKLVQHALEKDRSIRDVVTEAGYLTEDELDTVLDLETMTEPHGIDTELKDRVQDRLTE